MLRLDSIWAECFLHFRCLMAAASYFFCNNLGVKHKVLISERGIACKTGMSSSAAFTTSFSSLLDLPSPAKCSFQHDNSSWRLVASLPFAKSFVHSLLLACSRWKWWLSWFLKSLSCFWSLCLSVLALQKIRRCFIFFLVFFLASWSIPDKGLLACFYCRKAILLVWQSDDS